MSMNREQELQHRNDELLMKLTNVVDGYNQLEAIIEQLQADNSRLREAIEDALPTLKSEEKRSSLITRTLQKALASTDSSNWLQEQNAQWRREVLLDVETEIANKLLTDGYKAVQVIRRMAESIKAETDSLQNPAGKY
ncbi:MAG TPA: hypothetical protein VMW50_12115 [Dehalococcoidia bacterium]|nr:hypothetical protein [Dehalococcoidia bacterium]